MAMTAARNLAASLRGEEGAFVVKELR